MNLWPPPQERGRCIGRHLSGKVTKASQHAVMSLMFDLVKLLLGDRLASGMCDVLLLHTTDFLQPETMQIQQVHRGLIYLQRDTVLQLLVCLL